eukprot:881767-Rhodomonas_salina.1
MLAQDAFERKVVLRASTPPMLTILACAGHPSHEIRPHLGRISLLESGEVMRLRRLGARQRP